MRNYPVDRTGFDNNRKQWIVWWHGHGALTSVSTGIGRKRRGSRRWARGAQRGLATQGCRSRSQHLVCVTAVKLNLLHWHKTSVQSFDRLGRRGDMREDSTESSSSLFFCRSPLWVVLAWEEMCTPWCSPSSISSADHGVAQPPRCPEEWFWRDCRGVWHAPTIQVSVSWQLPEKVPVDPQRSWSCSTPRRWSCAPSRRCREVSSGTWFRRPAHKT